MAKTVMCSLEPYRNHKENSSVDSVSFRATMYRTPCPGENKDRRHVFRSIREAMRFRCMMEDKSLILESNAMDMSNVAENVA